MGAFVHRDFDGIAPDDRIGEVHLAAASDGALGSRPREDVRREARPEHRERIKLRLEIFEVQGEVQDVRVGDGGLRKCGAARQGADAARYCGHAHHRLEEGAPVGSSTGNPLEDL
ncbi:MAG TPA: hypothetical protein VEZ20_07475 [Allosphingosinicella sp.]|nr:hypothetical protein [Allosphingosinicella sp.]